MEVLAKVAGGIGQALVEQDLHGMAPLITQRQQGTGEFTQIAADAAVAALRLGTLQIQQDFHGRTSQRA
ncbi:hypothetical protein [Cyanobium sp. ULC082]